MRKPPIFFALFLSVVSVMLTGCKLAILDPKGIIAADEKHILVTAVLLMLIIVVPVIILTLFFAWKYRASNLNAKYTPDWAHSATLEIVWWSIPCIIIGILAAIAWASSHRLDPYRPIDSKLKPITIEVIALNWKWLFIYPDQKIATVNFLEIPVNVPIRLLVTSDAPMNSLEFPQLAGQIYAMTGMQTKLYLMANEIGDYRGLSTNFSGDGFSDMGFKVKVGSKQAFNRWVNKLQKSPLHLTMGAYKTLAKPSENVRPEYFSYAKDNLFHLVIAKYMMPMNSTRPMLAMGQDQHVHKMK